ncbi:uncharacterized protein LOC108111972 [Drosophila eugracilis]|uniref:uncharacterized protein LOC108111972 n=1 Tax=Drosophila eugracilis TaxID=29029 RepID=UPI0007E5FE18|nr:uncharacterized protein LOC108111972 [Drosophila eugracilis]
MEKPKDVEQKSPAPKTQAPEKPLRKRNQVKIQTKTRTPKQTPTAILCELTRLKAQQKYLECHQVKLNPNNFIIQDDEDSLDTTEPEPKVETEKKTVDKLETSQSTRPNSSSTADLISQINEIEQEKLVLNEKLLQYRTAKRGELQDMWHFVATVKEDVFRPERLSQYTVNALRERIIDLNAQLYRLTEQNSKELEELKKQYEKLERENKLLWKGSM